MSWRRQVAWVEREEKIYLVVMFVEAKDLKVYLDPEGIFTLSGSAGVDNNGYELKLELFDKVDVENSIVHIGENETTNIVVCMLIKTEKKWWNKLLHGDNEEVAPSDGMVEKSRTWVLRLMALLLRVVAHVVEMNGIYCTLLARVIILAFWLVDLVFKVGYLVLWVMLMAIYGLAFSVLVVVCVIERAARAAHVVAHSIWFLTLLASVKRMSRGILGLNVVRRMRC